MVYARIGMEERIGGNSDIFCFQILLSILFCHSKICFNCFNFFVIQKICFNCFNSQQIT